MFTVGFTCAEMELCYIEVKMGKQQSVKAAKEQSRGLQE